MAVAVNCSVTVTVTLSHKRTFSLLSLSEIEQKLSKLQVDGSPDQLNQTRQATSGLPSEALELQLVACNKQLAACKEELAAREAELAAREAELAARDKDLASCNEQLAAHFDFQQFEQDPFDFQSTVDSLKAQLLSSQDNATQPEQNSLTTAVAPTCNEQPNRELAESVERAEAAELEADELRAQLAVSAHCLRLSHCAFLTMFLSLCFSHYVCLSLTISPSLSLSLSILLNLSLTVSLSHCFSRQRFLILIL